MTMVICDKCLKSYNSDIGEIKKIYFLDVCYKCGNYEKIDQPELIIENVFKIEEDIEINLYK